MALSLSPAARHQLTNGLTAFSLGTLVFIRRWYDLEHLQPRGLDYFRSARGSLTLLEATVVAAGLLAALFWAAWYWVERHPTSRLRTFAYVTFLLILMYPIESVRLYWNTQTDHFDYGSNISLWVVEAILATGVVLALFGSTRVVKPARRVALLLMLLFPALMIDFLTNHLSAELAEVYTVRPPAPMLATRGPKSPRVVWIVFDELDQRMAFERRPPDLKLPELDRLVGESVAANHAIETSTFTAIALPSLISGRWFSNAQALDANTLELTPKGSSKQVDWRNEPNVFAQARTLGVNAALAGWHHPYCRILGDQLVDCLALPSTHSTAALAEEAQASRDGLWKTVALLFEWKIETLNNIVTGRGPSADDMRDRMIQAGQQQEFLQIRERAFRDVADPRIDLLLVHFPAPHMFPIYNRHEQNFNLQGSLDYFDNLALVDRTLGELRREVEKAGLADRTTLLLTADHGLRPGAWIGRIGWSEELDRLNGRQEPSRVPFILKLAGQDQPALIEKSFSNVASAELVLAVLSGKISTAPEAASWMNQRGIDEAGVQAAAASASVRSGQ